ncbi:uncharacterized protein METZ01_LOCUS83325 [marine metagenome]|uniref:Uncharacterized protein n=1 Tax=marine metagenome TaxID=408172 RepID=A0A381URU7_9ZZZZ
MQILIGILIGVVGVLAYQDPTVLEFIRSNINDLSTYMVKATSDVAVVVSH